jgi:hypothetical protein
MMPTRCSRCKTVKLSCCFAPFMLKQKYPVCISCVREKRKAKRIKNQQAFVFGRAMRPGGWANWL